jgi:hypothetical protein
VGQFSTERYFGVRETEKIFPQQAHCLAMRLTMKSQQLAVLMLVAAFFFPSGIVTANVCVDKNLRPLRHFCGTVVDSGGAPIPNAKVSVFKGGIEVAARSTDAAGEYSFDLLESGKYEFHAAANGFAKVSFPFVISNPSAKCKQKVEIQLAVGGEACGHVRLVKR